MKMPTAVRASSLWSQAVAASAAEPVRRATRRLYRYRPSLATKLKAATSSVKADGGSGCGSMNAPTACHPARTADRTRTRAILDPATASARAWP